MKKKKLFIFTGAALLVIVLVGLWGYSHYLKPDPKIQQQLNSQFGSDFFKSFDENGDIQLGPVNTEKFLADLGQKTDMLKIVSSMEKTKLKENSSQVSVPGTASASLQETGTTKSATQEGIENKYKSHFAYLQSVALGRLDTLYSAAIQEYEQNKKAGTLNRSELAQKYIQAGTMLEAGVDSEFNSTLNAMQTELIANNLPTNIVNTIKSDYEKAKSAKRSQLLAKVHI